jgi:hypothetical protein
LRAGETDAVCCPLPVTIARKPACAGMSGGSGGTLPIASKQQNGNSKPASVRTITLQLEEIGKPSRC